MIDSNETHYARWKAIELDKKINIFQPETGETNGLQAKKKKSVCAVIILETRTSLMKSFMHGA